MSRILVFDKENKQVGEVHAPVTRGWMISDGGSSTIALSNTEAGKPWIQLGRMVFIDGGGKVPNWAGVLDTPWNALTPVTLTAYDVPYLLSRKRPYYTDVQNGDIRKLALRFLELDAQLGDDYIREGEIETGDSARNLSITTASLWDQLKALVINSGKELVFRSEKSKENRLLHYLDIKSRFGVVSQVILQDGTGGNMQIQKADFDGEFWNAVIGTNQSSTATSKMYSQIIRDEDSINLYGIRNQIVQFDTVSQSDLDQITANYVALNGRPKLLLQVGVRDVDGLFAQLKLGNMLTVRATKLKLPGGIVGWRGQARVGAMTYNESSNMMTLNLEGVL